ncbi:MAG TPA: glycosyltransferase family 39 protein, partial [Chthoniobacteraceae bacterium]|nr:glycosyltransferase family 39 protein [Chthoniobacteraceae bacterium]
ATEFGIRFFSPILSLITALLMFRLARRLYSEEVAVWTTIGLSCVPIYQVGGLLMTIDPLSMCFWMAALYTCWRALEQSPRFSVWWPATGLLIGLGFLCKWTNALELLSIILLLAGTPKYRRELRHAGFWSMLAAFIPCTVPPIVWNAQNQWITIVHLKEHSGVNHATSFDPGEFCTFVGGQFAVYSPVIFAAMLAAIWLGVGRARLHFKPRFLLAFTLPILILYFTLSLREAGEANWTAPGTLSLGLLAAALVHELAAGRAWLRYAMFGGMALGAVMSLLILNTDLPRLLGLSMPYEVVTSAGERRDVDTSTRLRGWRTTAEVVEQKRAEFEKEHGPVFLIGNKYQTAAILSFYLHDPRIEFPGHPAVYIPGSQALENQFSFWPRYDELTEVTDIAREYVAARDAVPELREAISKALAALPKDDTTPGGKAADARRALVRELQRALPELPLDESFVEEAAVSRFQGHNALYITDRQEERAPSAIKAGFKRVEMISCLDLNRRGLPLRQIRIFACYNYETPGL